MQADERTRVVIHREWVLDAPAHHSEITKALTVAAQKRDAEAGHPSDIVFTHGDDLIVIGYTVEQPAATRAPRDAWQRKAEFSMATIKRVRRLAIAWSASASADFRVASGELHEILDGPGDGPEAGR